MPDERPVAGCCRRAVAAVVCTVSVPGALGVADAAAQVGRCTAPAGPEIAHVRVTVPLKLTVCSTDTVEVAEPPGLTEAGARAVAESEKVDPALDCVYLTTKASVRPPPPLALPPV